MTVLKGVWLAFYWLVWMPIFLLCKFLVYVIAGLFILFFD